MPVLSVRVDDELLALLKAYKVNISEVARQALSDEVRRQRALEGLERLKRWAAPGGPESVTDMIRRWRDER